MKKNYEGNQNFILEWEYYIYSRHAFELDLRNLFNVFMERNIFGEIIFYLRLYCTYWCFGPMYLGLFRDSHPFLTVPCSNPPPSGHSKRAISVSLFFAWFIAYKKRRGSISSIRRSHIPLLLLLFQTRSSSSFLPTLHYPPSHTEPYIFLKTYLFQIPTCSLIGFSSVAKSRCHVTLNLSNIFNEQFRLLLNSDMKLRASSLYYDKVCIDDRLYKLDNNAPQMDSLFICRILVPEIIHVFGIFLLMIKHSSFLQFPKDSDVF